MTELIIYEEPKRELMIQMIASFFADHFTISENEYAEVNPERLSLAEENLQDWVGRRRNKGVFYC